MHSIHTDANNAKKKKTKVKKSEIIKFYNCTKYGVFVVDQRARRYSVKTSSRRWPVQVFFTIY